MKLFLFKTVVLFVSFFVLTGQCLYGSHIGLLVMATGRYIQFVEPLIQSARKHFTPNHQVTYFVFTDSILPNQEDVLYFYQPKLGWPFDTMQRYHTYLANKNFLLEQDYLFACDADMLFVDTVGDEILSERVATLSPGFSPGSPYPRMRGAYETNPLSTAYVSDAEGDYYFAGGFYGGSREEFFKIIEINATHIDQDLQNGIIAEWHDESHWNRYCIDFPPTLILSPSYCYPENWKIPYTKRLLALDKNHKELREN